VNKLCHIKLYFLFIKSNRFYNILKRDVNGVTSNDKRRRPAVDNFNRGRVARANLLRIASLTPPLCTCLFHQLAFDTRLPSRVKTAPFAHNHLVE
jgi:hypothetical protein